MGLRLRANAIRSSCQRDEQCGRMKNENGTEMNDSNSKYHFAHNTHHHFWLYQQEQTRSRHRGHRRCICVSTILVRMQGCHNVQNVLYSPLSDTLRIHDQKMCYGLVVV